jgi:hypothetical protein
MVKNLFLFNYFFGFDVVKYWNTFVSEKWFSIQFIQIQIRNTLTGMYDTYTVFRIRIQWMQIEIRLVCPDPNYNKAQILDPDSMNPDPKHSFRYVQGRT